MNAKHYILASLVGLYACTSSPKKPEALTQDVQSDSVVELSEPEPFAAGSGHSYFVHTNLLSADSMLQSFVEYYPSDSSKATDTYMILRQWSREDKTLKKLAEFRYKGNLSDINPIQRGSIGFKLDELRLEKKYDF